MRLIDADEAKKLEQMLTLKPSEKALFRLMLDRMPTYEPPNPPLTLDELRKMDGEPVWVCNPKDIQQGHWALVRNDPLDVPEYNYCAYAVGISWSFSDYGKTWLAYRRKPEEGTT